MKSLFNVFCFFLIISTNLFSQREFIINEIVYDTTHTGLRKYATVKRLDFESVKTDIVIPNEIVLENVTCPVEFISAFAFSTRNLESVIIPNTVKIIHAEAFVNNKLTEIIIPEGIIEIGDVAFVGNQLTEIKIPDSVTKISHSSFVGNKLVTIELGKNLNIIESQPFTIDESSNNLKVIAKMTSNIPTYNKFFIDFFSNDFRSQIDLIIPTGTLATYTAAGWSGFKSITEDLTLSNNEFFITDNFTFSYTTNKIEITQKRDVIIENISMYDLTGKLLTTSKENKVDTEDLSSGLYIVQITTNKGLVSKKYVK